MRYYIITYGYIRYYNINMYNTMCTREDDSGIARLSTRNAHVGPNAVKGGKGAPAASKRLERVRPRGIICSRPPWQPQRRRPIPICTLLRYL